MDETTLTRGPPLRKNSGFFIAFLEYLLVTVYPGRRVALVMEDVAYHRSVATLAALCLFEHRVRVVWLPACCSDLNLFERFWRHLKDLACANKNDRDYPYCFQLSENL